MCKKDILYSLVKSMTKNEKGFFIKYSKIFSKDDSPAYLHLFQILDQMEDYNDSLLNEKIKNFITTEMLPPTKLYLKKIIFKCMHLFNDELSDEIILNDIFFSVEYSVKKRLYASAEKELLKAKKYIDSHELHHRLSEWAYWDRKMIYFSGHNDDTFKLLVENGKIENENHLKLKCNFEYHKLMFKANIVADNTKNNTLEKSLQFADELLKNSYAKKYALALTTRSKLYYCYFNSTILEMKNDWKSMKNIVEMQVSLLEQNKHFLMNNLGEYIGTLYNHIFFKICNHDSVHEIESEIAKLKAIPIEYKKRSTLLSEKAVSILAFNIEIHALIHQGNFEKIIVIYRLQGNTFFHEEPYEYIEKYVELYYNFAFAHFALGDYKNSLKCTNKIINRNFDLKTDFLLMNRFLNIIVHYELNNDSLVMNNVRSTYRVYKDVVKHGEFEKSLMDFIKLLIKDDKKDSGKLEVLRDELEQIKQECFQNNPYICFDITPWINAKINRTTFLEEYDRSKLKNKMQLH